MAWIILFVIYYVWGWKCAIEYNNYVERYPIGDGRRYSYSCEHSDGIIFAAFCGLSFIPWIMFMKRKYSNEQKDKKRKRKSMDCKDKLRKWLAR